MLFLKDVTVWNLDFCLCIQNCIFPLLERIWFIDSWWSNQFWYINWNLNILIYTKKSCLLCGPECFCPQDLLLLFSSTDNRSQIFISFYINPKTHIFFPNVTSPKSKCFLQLTVFYSHCQLSSSPNTMDLKSVDLTISQKVKHSYHLAQQFYF